MNRRDTKPRRWIGEGGDGGGLKPGWFRGVGMVHPFVRCADGGGVTLARDCGVWCRGGVWGIDALFVTHPRFVWFRRLLRSVII